MSRRPAIWPLVSLSLVCGAAFASDTPRAELERRSVEVKVERPARPGENARVKTKAGTFEVNEKNVELLRKTLAGEPVPGAQLWAGETP